MNEVCVLQVASAVVLKETPCLRHVSEHCLATVRALVGEDFSVRDCDNAVVLSGHASTRAAVTNGWCRSKYMLGCSLNFAY